MPQIKIVETVENCKKFEKYVQEETLKYWTDVYDTIYNAGKNQTVGWLDSRSGVEYTQEVLDYWADSFVSNIDCNNETPCILEIGVGTGLIFDRVKEKFPGAELWITDISSKALEGKSAYKSLLQTATNFENIPEDRFNIIIMNSVVQYFSTEDMLREVISKCQKSLRESNSYLIVGDIRDCSKMEFQKNVNRELLIHREFFGNNCKIIEMENKHNTEMELYRYAVKIPKYDRVEDWTRGKVNSECVDSTEDYILFKKSKGYMVNGYLKDRFCDYQYRCDDIGRLNLPIKDMPFSIESLKMECKLGGNIAKTADDFIISSSSNVFDLIGVSGDIAVVDTDGCKHCYKKLLDDVDDLVLPPSKVVVIFMKKSYEYVVAILHCLKNRIPFLPLDPKIPRKRLDDILSNFSSEDYVVLSSLNQYFTTEQLSREPVESDICYYVFTSGSTAKPKLIPLKPLGLINFVLEHQRIVGISKDDVVLHFFNVAFDASLWAIVSTLCWGARLVLWNENKDLNKTIESNQVNVMFMLPSFVEALNNRSIQLITKLSVAGESVSSDVFDIPIEEIYNVYGPSEVTIASHVTRMSKQEGVHVGKGLNNVKWELNEETNEIMISGVGVTPLEKNYYYCTGDKGHISKDGNLVVDGRLDRQIKLNGFRLNLDEIGKHISGYALIQDDTLYGFVDSEPELKKSYLESVLPKYMIPSKWVQVGEFPRTDNGKINVRKLKEYISKPLEKLGESKSKIEKILSEYVSLDCPRTTTHIFDTGLQSIQVYKLFNQIRKEMNVIVDSKILFKNPTITEFVDSVSGLVPKSIKGDRGPAESHFSQSSPDVVKSMNSGTWWQWLEYIWYVFKFFVSMIYFYPTKSKIAPKNVEVLGSLSNVENVVFSVHPHGPTGDHIWELFGYIKSNISKNTKMFLFQLLNYSLYYRFIGGISDKIDYNDVQEPLLVTPGYKEEIFSGLDNPCSIKNEYHFFEQIFSSKKDIVPVYVFDVNRKYSRIGKGYNRWFMQPFVWKKGETYDNLKVIFGNRIRASDCDSLDDLRKEYMICMNKLGRISGNGVEFI